MTGSTEPMNDYRANRAFSLYLLSSFPRSAAVIFASATAAIMLDPMTALTRAMVVWLVLTVLLGAIRLALPNFVDLGIWLACSYVVLPVVAWFVKWPALVVGGLIAAIRGSPVVETASVLGAILVVDVVVSVLLRK